MKKEVNTSTVVIPKGINLIEIFKDSQNYPYILNKQGKLVQVEKSGYFIKRAIQNEIYFILSLIAGNRKYKYNEEYSEIPLTALPFNHKKARQVINTLKLNNIIVEKPTKKRSVCLFKMAEQYTMSDYDVVEIMMDYKPHKNFKNINNKHKLYAEYIMRNLTKLRDRVDEVVMKDYIVGLRYKRDEDGETYTIKQIANYFNSLLNLKYGFNFVSYSDNTKAFYNTYSNTPKRLRPFLGLFEIDLSSSVFWVLPTVLKLDENNDETIKYINAVEKDIYEYIGRLFNKNRKVGKEIALKHWLNTDNMNNPYYKIIKSEFPTITDKIEKKKNIESRYEYSKFMNYFNDIISKIINGSIEIIRRDYDENVIAIPVVDCVAVEKGYENEIVKHIENLSIKYIGRKIKHKIN